MLKCDRELEIVTPKTVTNSNWKLFFGISSVDANNEWKRQKIIYNMHMLKKHGYVAFVVVLAVVQSLLAIGVTMKR